MAGIIENAKGIGSHGGIMSAFGKKNGGHVDGSSVRRKALCALELVAGIIGLVATIIQGCAVGYDKWIFSYGNYSPCIVGAFYHCGISIHKALDHFATDYYWSQNNFLRWSLYFSLSSAGFATFVLLTGSSRTKRGAERPPSRISLVLFGIACLSSISAQAKAQVLFKCDDPLANCEWRQAYYFNTVFAAICGCMAVLLGAFRFLYMWQLSRKPVRSKNHVEMTHFPEAIDRPMMQSFQTLPLNTNDIGLPCNTVSSCTSFFTVDQWE